MASKLGKTPAELSVYDPFYCQGSMVKRMQHCGFHNVYNKKEDFYEKQRTKTVPEYDVLVTNPPYSGTHMRKLIQFVHASNKPYCLLVPNYVYMKDYYQEIVSPVAVTWEPGAVTPTVTKSTKQKAENFYIVPNKRYLYTTPNGRRQGKSAKYTSPFPTFWYCNIGPNSRDPANPPNPMGSTKAFLAELKERLTNTNSNRAVPGSVNSGTTSASSYSNSSHPVEFSTDNQEEEFSEDQQVKTQEQQGYTNTYKIANNIATLPMEIRCDEDPLKKAQKDAQHRKKNKMSQKERNSHKSGGTKRPKSNVR